MFYEVENKENMIAGVIGHDSIRKHLAVWLSHGGLLPPSTPLSTHSYDYYKKDGMGKSGKIEAKKRVYSTD